MSEPTGPDLNPDLTTRGKVRELLRRGWTPAMIRDALGITKQSVYFHMDAIRQEMAGADDGEGVA